MRSAAVAAHEAVVVLCAVCGHVRYFTIGYQVPGNSYCQCCFSLGNVRTCCLIIHRPLYPTAPVHPVSVLILRPREMQKPTMGQSYLTDIYVFQGEAMEPSNACVLSELCLNYFFLAEEGHNRNDSYY